MTCASNKRARVGARVSGWNGPLLERKKGLEEQKEQLHVEDEMVGVH